MVQLYKRLIKYRTTGAPELVFVNDHLLLQACLRIVFAVGSDTLLDLPDAVRAVKLKRKKVPPNPLDPPDAILLGAARDVEAYEADDVVPPLTGERGVPVTGLPYMLAAQPELKDEGWPVGHILPGLTSRVKYIMRRLGYTVGTRPGDAGAWVRMKKYVRAALPCGDTASSLQCLSQSRKDNSWFLIQYECSDGGRLLYIGQVRYYVRVQLKTADGTGMLPHGTTFALPLRLAVVDLFTCQTLAGRSVRQACADMQRPPEFMTVATLERTGESRADKPFAGTWVVDVRSITCVVVPTKAIGARRYFMVANKASGRVGSLRRM